MCRRQHRYIHAVSAFNWTCFQSRRLSRSLHTAVACSSNYGRWVKRPAFIYSSTAHRSSASSNCSEWNIDRLMSAPLPRHVPRSQLTPLRRRVSSRRADKKSACFWSTAPSIICLPAPPPRHFSFLSFNSLMPCYTVIAVCACTWVHAVLVASSPSSDDAGGLGTSQPTTAAGGRGSTSFFASLSLASYSTTVDVLCFLVMRWANIVVAMCGPGPSIPTLLHHST